MEIESALVLSGSIGRGHDSVADACRNALTARGVDGEILDSLALLGGLGSRIGMTVFRRLLSVPTVYDGFHFSHLRTGSRLSMALERASSKRLVPALEEKLASYATTPLLVSVFPTGVTASARLKEEHPEIRVVAVCTDASAHRMWVYQGVDLYVVCSMLAALTVRRYDADANLALVPPPVRRQFFAAPERLTARQDLGVPEDASCVLLMAGGWGLGPLADSAVALAEAGYSVLAVAGANRRLEARLHQVAARYPSVRPFGLTDRVPELMAAADAVVTTPGQTCHEARVVGRWLVVLDIVPGHGRENALHELEMGGALSCSPDPDSIVGSVRVMFADRPDMAPWPVESAEAWDKHWYGALSTIGLSLEGRSD